jgi:Kef-type K+ transport system membrane component KefB
MLRHFNVKKTVLGKKVISATISTEILVFILASILVSVTNAGDFSWNLLLEVILRVLFFLIGTYFLGSQILPYLNKYLNRTNTKAFTFSLIVALFFGLFAEFIGLHIILGAYLGGVFVRKEITNPKIFDKIEDRFFGFAYSFLGPIFFASIGMQMTSDVFLETPMILLVLVLIVIIGQFLGAGGMYFLLEKNKKVINAAFLSTGLLGRGATDIVIAAIGLEIGLLNNSEFSLLVTTSILMIFLAPIFFKILKNCKAYQPQFKDEAYPSTYHK